MAKAGTFTNLDGHIIHGMDPRFIPSSLPIHKPMTIEGLCQWMRGIPLYNDWDLTRWFADGIHLFALVVPILAIWFREQGMRGVSFKTQVLLALCEIMHLFSSVACVHRVFKYMFGMELTFMALGAAMFFGFISNPNMYQLEHDTCAITPLIIPTFILVSMFGDQETPFAHCWNLSVIIEGFSGIPQLIFCYRDANPDWEVKLMCLFLFGYQALLGGSWIYELLADIIGQPKAKLFPMSSAAASTMHVSIFVDYCLHIFCDVSFFRSTLIRVDDALAEIYEALEKMSGIETDWLKEWCTRCSERQPQVYPTPRWMQKENARLEVMPNKPPEEVEMPGMASEGGVVATVLGTESSDMKQS